jgi:hypothetical protein
MREPACIGDNDFGRKVRLKEPSREGPECVPKQAFYIEREERGPFSRELRATGSKSGEPPLNLNKHRRNVDRRK